MSFEDPKPKKIYGVDVCGKYLSLAVVGETPMVNEPSPPDNRKMLEEPIAQTEIPKTRGEPKVLTDTECRRSGL